MGIEEVRFPVVPVLDVDVFDVRTHVCGEQLGKEKDKETRFEGGAAEVDTRRVYLFALCW